VPITGQANEIVALSGQIVIQNPENFGLTSDEIMAMLSSYGDDKYSPINEYKRFLADPSIDLSHTALLWKSSKIVYKEMIKHGWALIDYDPPFAIHFTMIQDVAKRQIASAAEHFSLLQMDKIVITIVKNFGGLLDKYPHASRNKTLVFTKDEFKGFSGTFGGVMDWSNGSDAPNSNFLYFRISKPYNGTWSAQMNVPTQTGYAKRWGIRFRPNAAEIKTDEYSEIGRIPRSLMYSISNSDRTKLGIATTKNGIVMYSDKTFFINPSDVEILQNGKWK
jgi:hypothetical protein